MVIMKEESTKYGDFRSYNMHSTLRHLSNQKIKHRELEIDAPGLYPREICDAKKKTRKRPTTKY